MLRIESYITPFLTSYLNRFILNLTSEDLKLSIWGGDVVLTNLKLRLDIAESLAGLPFRINSVSIMPSNVALEFDKHTLLGPHTRIANSYPLDGSDIGIG